MIRIIVEILNKYKEIISYLVFGVLTTIVNLSVYYILGILFINPNNAIELQIANIISWVASVVFAYITNRKYVFKSENKDAFKEISSFFGSRIFTLIMDMIIMFIGVSVFNGSDKIFKLISQVVVIIFNYVFSKLFVFKK